ncbi:MAG: S8 family serine peptidase, partial [Clostridia bacterium]|nr:S8 family serine peptidase [Clostridia bacterium]
QWGLETVHAPEAWDAVSAGGGQRVVLAVVDSGVDASHPDLAGRVDVDRGRNFVSGIDMANFQDDNGHGTHVAGIAAAVAGNGQGIAGVAGAANVIVLPVKAFDQYGLGRAFDIEQGIRYAADQGADVINASFGTVYSRLIAEAVAYAQEKGALMVASAGNESGPVSSSYPAALPGVLAVSAIDSSGTLADFSNYGPEVALAAPGVDVLSTVPTFFDEDAAPNGYTTMSGTSMAAPFVAGAAALLKAVHPEYTAQELARALTETARDAGGEGFDERYGHGILDVAAAVASAVYASVTVDLVAPSGFWRVAGVTDLKALVSDPGPVARVDFYLDLPAGDLPAGADPTRTPPIATGSAGTENPAAYTARYDFTGTPGGRHTLTAVARDASGAVLDRDDREIEVVGEPASGLTIKVLDPAGNPAVDADVSIYHVDGNTYEWDENMVGPTGPEGLLRLPGSLATDGNTYLVIAFGTYEVPGTAAQEPFLVSGRVEAPGELVLDARQARRVQVGALGRPSEGGQAPPLADSDVTFLLAQGGRVLLDDEGDPLGGGFSLAQLDLATDDAGQVGVWLSDGEYRILVESDAMRHYLFRDVRVDASTGRVTVDAADAVLVGLDRTMKGANGDPDVPAAQAFLNLYPAEPTGDGTFAEWHLGPYFDVTEGPAVVSPGLYDTYFDLAVTDVVYAWWYAFYRPGDEADDRYLRLTGDTTLAVAGPLSLNLAPESQGPYAAGEDAVSLGVEFTDANRNLLVGVEYEEPGMIMSASSGDRGGRVKEVRQEHRKERTRRNARAGDA